MKENPLDKPHSFLNKWFKTNYKQIKKILSSDSLLFFSEFLKNPKKIGSLIPSSSNLGKAITRYLKSKDCPPPVRYLEVGAGTGSFTSRIIKKMSSQDKLDLIEIDPNFCKILEKKFTEYKNVKIHCSSILTWNPDYKYHFIISSIPFNSLDSETVEKILAKYESLIRNRGIISFYEYLGLPKIKKMFLGSDAKNDYKKTLDLLKHFSAQYEFASERVLANFPPAIVHHCKVLFQ